MPPGFGFRRAIETDEFRKREIVDDKLAAPVDDFAIDRAINNDAGAVFDRQAAFDVSAEAT